MLIAGVWPLRRGEKERNHKSVDFLLGLVFLQSNLNTAVMEKLNTRNNNFRKIHKVRLNQRAKGRAVDECF